MFINENPGTVDSTTTAASTDEGGDIAVSGIEDFGIDFLPDEGSEDGVQSPDVVTEKKVADVKEETTSADDDFLRVAEERLARRMRAREDKSLAAELKREKLAREELAKKMENPLDVIGGVQGLNQLARDIVAGKHEVKTPEQLEKEALAAEIAELKAFRDEQRAEREAAQAARVHAEEVAAVEALIKKHEDDFPYLAASSWPSEWIKDTIVQKLENGHASSPAEALKQLNEAASIPVQGISRNKKALKKMFESEENRALLSEVLAELGIVPQGKKLPSAAKNPSSLTSAIKADMTPSAPADDELLDDETMRRRMKEHLRELNRKAAGGFFD